ncbi:MAG TPA: phytanoyl-CoA dioxygenase family protein [Abditibacteriaceae bacterium]|nr:phytanoyl-CoA dioxygenase family protein [Abditibacteriaceae bacterium]
MKTKFPELDLDLSFHPVHCDAPRRFTHEQIDEYNRDGYISGITIFEGAELEQIQAFFETAKQELTEIEVFRSFHHTMPELYDIVTRPLLVEYLQDLLGPDVVCFVSQYVRKEPGSEQIVVWHQDASFNPMAARGVVVWLALDDATLDNGCMRFIPGSHWLGGLDFTQSGGHEVGDAEAHGAPIPVELKSGQAVFFSDLLLHSSPRNCSAAKRRGGFTMTFTSTGVVPHLHGNQASVLCSGEDANNNWQHHPRPTQRTSP